MADVILLISYAAVNFVFETMNFVSKMMNFVFKMMNTQSHLATL